MFLLLLFLPPLLLVVVLHSAVDNPLEIMRRTAGSVVSVVA